MTMRNGTSSPLPSQTSLIGTPNKRRLSPNENTQVGQISKSSKLTPCASSNRDLREEIVFYKQGSPSLRKVSKLRRRCRSTASDIDKEDLLHSTQCCL